MTLTVCSFYVDRRRDYPDAVDYMPLLRALDRSCRRFGIEHLVLTDHAAQEAVGDAMLKTVATDLPRALSRATTEAQARYLESEPAGDTVFVGADCLVCRDFRPHLAPADLSIVLRPGKHRINNGFMFVPAASRGRVAPLFRRIADSTGEAMCDDMVAVEKALAPMPAGYGLQERHGLAVNFLPMGVWNAGPKTADDPAAEAHVLHFRGLARKAVMLDWARRWLNY